MTDIDAQSHDPWTYRARVSPTADVVDGDTLDPTIDLGFGTIRRGREARIRLLGVDTHEIHTVSDDSEEYQRGWREKQFVEHWLMKAREEHDGDFPLLLRTVKGDERGKYGRWLAEVYRLWDGECLNERLKEEFEGVATDV